MALTPALSRSVRKLMLGPRPSLGPGPLHHTPPSGRLRPPDQTHHFPPFHDHVEEALAGRSPVSLGKLEGYHIVTVGQGDGVGKVAKAHAPVEDTSVVSAMDTVLVERLPLLNSLSAS